MVFSYRPVVLVIEDEILIRMDAVDIATNAGFDALEAASSDEAITMPESREDIRVIFTDINIPGLIDGLKLAHVIRQRWPQIGVIVTSAYTTASEDELPSGGRFFSQAIRRF